MAAVKYGTSAGDGEIIKGNTIMDVGFPSPTAQGTTAQHGWWATGNNQNGYTISQIENNHGPVTYCPANDDEVILFCNMVANPAPSSTITTIEDALMFLQTSNYLVLYNDSNRGIDPPDNFPEKLPMDGLSCYVDTQIDQSIATANRWLDVSGNGLNFQSYGTALQLTSLGNIQAFQFNNSGYFQANDLYGSVDMGGDCTLVMWVWCTQITERDTIFEKVGNGASSYQQEIAVTWETSEAFSYYSRQTPNYDSAGTSACDTDGGNGAWTMMAIKMSTGRTAAPRTGFYSKNGNGWTANYNSRSNTALNSALQIRIGRGYAGPVEGPNGIGAVLTYNKMLSNAEIKDVFDSMKGRYGL